MKKMLIKKIDQYEAAVLLQEKDIPSDILLNKGGLLSPLATEKDLVEAILHQREIYVFAPIADKNTVELEVREISEIEASRAVLEGQTVFATIENIYQYDVSTFKKYVKILTEDIKTLKFAVQSSRLN